jgi:hypothetical protein
MIFGTILEARAAIRALDSSSLGRAGYFYPAPVMGGRGWCVMARMWAVKL